MNEIGESPPMTNTEMGNFIEGASYKVQSRVISRCIDGRYPSDESLPALAIPGADIGQIIMLFATANKIKLALDVDNTFKALIEVVGGVENIRVHTDSHGKDKGIAAGCGYFAQVKARPEFFGVTQDQVSIIGQKFEDLIKQGAKEIELPGKHTEEGALIVTGDKSIRPQGKYFIYHKSLVDERNRKLVDALFADNEIMANKFYHVLTGTTDEHVRKIKNKLAPNIPTHTVDFSADGKFKLQKVAII